MGGERFSENPEETPEEIPAARDRNATLEYIGSSRAFFADRFAGDQEAQESITRAIDFLVVEDDKHHQEVSYHNPDHALSMARGAIAALDNIEKQRPDIPLPPDKLMATATILHDMGYYSRDPEFGTMRVDHETRSQNYLDERVADLKLSDDELRSAKIMIEGTRFTTPLLNVEDIANPAETEVPTESQADILSRYGIDKQSFSELDDQERAALLGASVMGVLDILGTDHNYLTGVVELQKEFKVDKDILEQHLKSTMDGNVNETTIKAVAGDNRAAQEYGKIPLAPTGLDQVKNSKFFWGFVVPNRIAPTGLVEVEGKEMLLSAGSLLGEEIVAEARANQDKVYQYFDEGIVPEEVAHLAEQ